MLYGTGYNQDGQLGTGDNSNRNVFTAIPGNWSQMACGGTHTMVLSTGTGKWFGTGSNFNGQLGTGNNLSLVNFTSLPGNWSQMVCGENHTMALSAGTEGVNWTARMTDSTRGWTGIAMSSDGRIQTAVVDNINIGRVYTSYDYGVTWTARMTDSGRLWSSIAMSSDGRIQTAVVYFGQIYTSYDYGVTWTARNSNRGWYDVAMSSDGRIQTACIASGGQIYTSYDYGVTWTARMTDSNRAWFGIDMSSDGRIQTATGGSLIWTSYDYGVTWTARMTDILRNWRQIAMSADGRIQSATDGDRIYTSYDYGVTWTARESSRNWSGIAMSSDGRIQTAADPTVSGGGKIYTSYNYGVTWTARENNRNWWRIAMSSDGTIQTATVNGGYLYTSYATRWFGTGYNSFGQLGLGDNIDKYVFTQLPLSGNWIQIACGHFHTMALSAGTNRLFGTGRNHFGQLGTGDNTERNVFTQITGNWSQVVCGENHTMALSAGTNRLFGTGRNTYGQLGTNDNADTDVFTALTGNWSQVVCGHEHTMAWSAGTNQWFGTGRNNFGQLGLGDNTNRNVFTALTGVWSQVICGSYHTVALSAGTDQWFGTGLNNTGQLGTGDNSNRNVFTAIPGNWSQIACGSGHTMALSAAVTTPTGTPTSTPTVTPTPTNTPTNTPTPSNTSTNTPTPTPTITPTPSVTQNISFRNTNIPYINQGWYNAGNIVNFGSSYYGTLDHVGIAPGNTMANTSGFYSTMNENLTSWTFNLIFSASADAFGRGNISFNPNWICNVNGKLAVVGEITTNLPFFNSILNSLYRTSTDGINWSTNYFPASAMSWSHITNRGTRVIAVANSVNNSINDSRIYYSDNFSSSTPSWTQAYAGFINRADSVRIIDTGTKFFLGNILGIGPTGTSGLSSTNGTSWSPVTYPRSPNGFCFGNGKFIIAAGLSAFVSQDPFSSWTVITSSFDTTCWDVMYSSFYNLYLIPSNNGVYYTSSDGYTWQKTTSVFNTDFYKANETGNKIFLYSGSQTIPIIVSN